MRKRTVFKYPIPVMDEFSIGLPDGAEILHVGVQVGVPCMWVLVSPRAPKKTRRFRCAGTGHVIVGAVRHCGTFLLGDGGLVFHLFEIVEDDDAHPANSVQENAR